MRYHSSVFCRVFLFSAVFLVAIVNQPASSKIQSQPTPSLEPSMRILSGGGLVHPYQTQTKTVLVTMEDVSADTQKVTFSLNNGSGVLGYAFEIAYIANTTTIVEDSFTQLLPDSPFIKITEITGLWKVEVSSLTEVQDTGPVDLFSIHVMRNEGISTDIPIRLFFTDKTNVNNGEFVLQAELPIVLFQHTVPPTDTPTTPPVNSTNTPVANPTDTPIAGSPDSRLITVQTEAISDTVSQITVGIEHIEGVSSYQFEFAYDENLVQLVDRSVVQLMPNSPTGFGLAIDGFLRFIATSPNAVESGGFQELFSFQVERLSDDPTVSIELTITDSSRVNDGFVEIHYNPVVSLFQTAEPSPTPVAPTPTATRGIFPTATPTHTPIPTLTPTPGPRKLTVLVEPVSDTLRLVTVGIDDALDLSILRFEFTYDSTLVGYVVESYENLLFTELALVNEISPGTLQILATNSSPSTHNGSHQLFSFMMERSAAPTDSSIMLEIAPNTSVNANEFALLIPSDILLFGPDEATPTVTPTDTAMPVITPTDTPLPVLTPTNTPIAIATPSNTMVPVITPTNTPIMLTATPTTGPESRIITAIVEDISETEQKVTVKVDNALDIIGYRFEFQFDPTLVSYKESSFQDLIFDSPYPFEVVDEGKILFLTSDVFPATSGAADLFSLHMIKTADAANEQAIELIITDSTTINDGVIPVWYESVIKLFDDSSSGEGNGNEFPVIYEFDQAELSRVWNLIPGGFTDAETGIMIPEFNLRAVIPSSTDNTGYELIVNPGQVVLIHPMEPVDSGGSPVLLRLTARSVTDNGALALVALQGSVASGEGLDGSVATNIPADTNRIMDSEGRIMLLYQPGTETRFTPVIQLASTSDEIHETVFVDKLEIIKLDDEQFQFRP